MQNKLDSLRGRNSGALLYPVLNENWNTRNKSQHRLTEQTEFNYSSEMNICFIFM